MQKKFLAVVAAMFLAGHALAQTEVRLAVHKSFNLPKDAFAAFEHANDAKVSVIKVGSGNEMVNKLVLSRSKPIADAVYGLDNTTVLKAKANGVLAAVQPKSAAVDAALPHALAVDSGYVALNYGLPNANCPCRKRWMIWPSRNIRICWPSPIRVCPVRAWAFCWPIFRAWASSRLLIGGRRCAPTV